MLQGMRTLDSVGEQRRAIARTHLADIRRLEPTRTKQIVNLVAAFSVTLETIDDDPSPGLNLLDTELATGS